MKKSKVLSVEYNIAHDVIRPSIYKHFKDIGYQVEFLLAENEEKKRWNFFTRIDDDIKTTTATYDEMDKILTSNKMKEYDFIIFNTSFSFMPDFKNIDIPIVDAIYKNTGKYPQPKYGFITIPPHVSGYVDKNKNCILKNKKISKMYIVNQLGYGGIPMFATNYFGNVKILPKSKENIFLATGNISAQKNHKLLITASEKLVKDGITNFKIVINGVGEKLDIPEYLNKYFEFLGDNKPDKLFEIIENCDFITALLDSTMEWQRNQYGHGTCSCSLMYSLGFNKPLVVEDYFVENYGLDSSNSIIYNGQDLYSGMKQAILISEEKYRELQKNLAEYYNECEIKSVSDLKKLINNIKKEKFISDIFRIEKDEKYKYVIIMGFVFKIKRKVRIFKRKTNR